MIFSLSLLLLLLGKIGHCSWGIDHRHVLYNTLFYPYAHAKLSFELCIQSFDFHFRDFMEIYASRLVYFISRRVRAHARLSLFTFNNSIIRFQHIFFSRSIIPIKWDFDDLFLITLLLLLLLLSSCFFHSSRNLNKFHLLTVN